MSRPPRPRLILASSSPRRHQLLASAGYRFEILPPDVDETLKPGPLEAAIEDVARRKARAIPVQAGQEAFVLAADTLVEVGGEVLGKPRDREDARRMLGLLSGAEHRVHTGVALWDQGTDRLRSRCATTRMWMRVLRDEEIAAYVASGESDGKAGAYAVQETADRFVERREGAFDNVVGLPLAVVAALIRELDGPTPIPPSG